MELMSRKPMKDRLHSARIERKGRILLEDALFDAEFEVAVPWNDSGIDLIAYRSLDAEGAPAFHARPIQLKASSGESFGVNTKYGQIAGLLIVHVWHVTGATCPPQFFAMTYREAIEIAKTRGWTTKSKWERDGSFVVPQARAPLKELLMKHEMKSREDWRRKLMDQACDGRTAG
jgi:hypothetical protein